MSITTTKKLLETLSTFVKDMNSDNSTKYKSKIFVNYADKYPSRDAPFLRMIRLVNNTLIPFRVTSKSILKFKNNQKKGVKGVLYKDRNTTDKLAIFSLLKELSDGKLSGHKALKSVIDFCEQYNEHEQLILNIIDKDLKTRFTGKNINKIVSDLVPMFEVSLAKSYKDCKKEVNKPYKNGWYISRKLDGVRCIAMIKFEELDNFRGSKSAPNKQVTITFYSRTGNQFLTLKKLNIDINENIIKSLNNQRVDDSQGFVLDGEVCKMDAHGNEDFQGIMKEINKKNHTMENPKYVLFDMLTIEEFERCSSERLLSTRLAQLNEIMSQSGCKRLSCVEQVPYSEQTFASMQEQVKEKGWEGLMLRKNDKYQGKRSKDILKVKQFHREEYVVVGIEFAKMRVINEKSGLEEEIETLKAAQIEHKGYIVSVGSGFKMYERKAFYKDPAKIKGKLISVQFFEETQDMDGNLSLRFPTYQGIYGDKREF